MENSRSCKHCFKKTLVVDDESGNLICSSCGIVQDFDNYQHQAWDTSGPTGQNIRVGTSGSGYNYSYRDTKIYLAQKIVGDILYKLDLETRSNEVNSMIKTITEEEYGQGDWFPILVGACIYTVMRKAKKPLPLTKVAACIDCDVHELGRMVYRVVNFLKLRLPEFDIVELFDKSITKWLSFRNVQSYMVDRMLKQGIFLIQCMIKWFVTTGRRPVPVVVAVIVFVAELNEVDVNIEDLARELDVAVVTCRLRYKELLERLVVVARDNLPWGKDVTVKNIMKNAPFVIQYMEMKSRCKNGKEDKSFEEVGIHLDGLIGECLEKRDDYRGDTYGSCETEIGSKYFELERLPAWSIEDLEKLNLSHECLSTIYLKYLDEVSEMKERMEDNRRTKRRGSDFLEGTEYWTGESELSKKLFLEQILGKDVGLNAMPPSFVSGCLAYERRREKIKAAKLRIQKIMDPPALVDSGEKDDLCLALHEKGKKGKQRRRGFDTDWEDFVIETLLLNRVKEEEIEKGYYNTLLDLHVFNSGIIK